MKQFSNAVWNSIRAVAGAGARHAAGRSRLCSGRGRADKPALARNFSMRTSLTDLFRGKDAKQGPRFCGSCPSSPYRATRGAQVKPYTYGEIGDVQTNLGRDHVLRVWVKRPGGWKAIAYQEVRSLDVPPAFAPGAGKDLRKPLPERIPL